MSSIFRHSTSPYNNHCSSLFDNLGRHIDRASLNRRCSTLLSERCLTTSSLIEFSFTRAILFNLGPACLASFFDLVRTLVPHPCSKLPRACPKGAFLCGSTLVDHLFASCCTTEVLCSTLVWISSDGIFIDEILKIIEAVW